MRIWWHRNARVYEGSPVEIVRQMQMQDMGKRKASLGEYVDAMVHDAKHWGFELTVTGETEEERATSLIASMLNTRLARPV